MSEYDGRRPEPVYKTESELLDEAVDERDEMLHKIQRLEQELAEEREQLSDRINDLEFEYNRAEAAERERDRYREVLKTAGYTDEQIEALKDKDNG